MRVLLATDTYLPVRSGIVRSVCELAGGLADRGHDVAIVVPTTESKASLPRPHPRVPVHGVYGRPIPLVTPRPVPMPRAARRDVGHQLDDFLPDVVHAATPFAIGNAALAAGRARGVRTALSVHILPTNVTAHSPVAALGGPLSRHFLRARYQQCAAAADCVSAPSAVAAAYAEALVGQNVRVISNGIPAFASRIPSLPPRRTVEIPRALYVGRLSREKRVDVLVRALSFLPEWTLTIVGSGPRSAALRRAARRFAPGRVKFAGDLSDDLLAAEYAAADLFCMPSPAEFECVAALEALNFGLPLVVPRAGALTEIADEEAVAAYADPDDAEALAACVTGLHPDRIERSGIAAAARHLAADRPLHRTLDLWVDAYTVDQPTPPRSSLGKPATAPWTATQIIRTRGGAHVRTWLAGPESARDTLILLHGIAVNSDTCWRAVVPLLPKGCRIVALDFYGHGSDRPCGADLSIAGYAVAALDTLDALGVRQATIVGHSLGGTVAQVMALRAQERQSPLSGIILSSTASRFADTRLRRAKFAAAAAATPAMAAAPECAQIQAGRMFARLKCFDTRDGFRANEYNWPQVMRVGQELCLFDSRPWVNMLSLPCFAIVTVHDRVVPVSIQQDLVGRLNWRGFIETPMEHDASMTSAGNYAAAVRVGLEWLRDAHRQARGVP